MKKYDVNYFIKKFSKIPDNKWITGRLSNGTGGYCAIGHCGGVLSKETTGLIRVLSTLSCTPVVINDNLIVDYRNQISADVFGDTPKERIINALVNIKEMT